MVLIPPKRLFNVETMETVMYEDVADDVKEKGYIAISHVWGSQRKYVPKGVGVMGGVTWTIPLSDPEKISKVRNVVRAYEMKYCWLDVVCLPQDKQDEINLEIPFMGDYYAGSRIVLVLATVDPVISKNFTKWCDIMDDVMEKMRDFTNEERKWISSYNGPDLVDTSKEKWFTRLWTFQEAIMGVALVLVCNNGEYVDLFHITARLEEMNRRNIATILFKESGLNLIGIANSKSSQRCGTLDLMQVINECSRRDCFKPQDKFYGAFGVLGYRDFPVDYDINMEDLNKKIIQYAYSKGDISWLSVGGDIGSGFIQPMDKPFPFAGLVWKEDSPGICGIRLEGEIMHINTWTFAEVVCREKIHKGVGKTIEFRGDMYKVFKGWNLDSKDVIKNISEFRAMSDDEAEVAVAMLEQWIGNKKAYKTAATKFGNDIATKYWNLSDAKMVFNPNVNEVTIVKAKTWEGKNIPLRVIGEADVGDLITIIRMTDVHGGVLGIVCDKYFRRKGVCLCEKMDMTEEKILSRFTPQEFPL